MNLRSKLLTDTILAEPFWPHLCFAEQDGVEPAGGGGSEAQTQPSGEDEIEIEEDGQAPEDTDELEIGPDKVKVPKKVKEAWNGLQKTTQAEREEIRAEKAKVAAERASIAETQRLHAAVMDEVADIKSAEKAIKGIDERLGPYLKLSASDWMAWNEQEPEKAQQAQRAVQALQMERAGLVDARSKATESAQKKYGELQQKQNELTQQQKAQQAAAIAAAEKDIPGRIKDWSPEKAAALQKYATESGITTEQYESIKYSPVALSVLDKAAKYDAAVARAAKAREAAAAAKTEAEPKPEPLPKMKGSTGSGVSAAPRDSDPPDVWMKKRNAQLARNRGR